MPTPTPGKLEDKEELVRRWKELVEKIDKELTEKGLNDEQREQLIREILEEGDGEA